MSTARVSSRGERTAPSTPTASTASARSASASVAAPHSASPGTIIEVDEHHLIAPSLTLLGAHGCLVAFDSHDDLGVPPSLHSPEGASLTASVTAGQLDIGTWILPAIFAGAFSTVLWINKWAKNLPHTSFCASLGPHAFPHGSALAVLCDPAEVPAAWRALWADYCLPPSAITPAEQRALKFVPFRVVMTDAAGAHRNLKAWADAARREDSVAVGAPPPRAASKRPRDESGPVPLPRRFMLSVDLDYFSVNNPAKRSVPWAGDPGFRRDLIAFESMVAGEDSPHDALPAVAKAAGIKPDSAEGEKLLSLLASCEVKFNEDIKSLPSLRAVLDNLLLMNLAEHASTHEELAVLEKGFAGVVARVMARGGGGVWPAHIARSELYTPPRQLADIRARARRAIEAAAKL